MNSWKELSYIISDSHLIWSMIHQHKRQWSKLHVSTVFIAVRRGGTSTACCPVDPYKRSTRGSQCEYSTRHQAERVQDAFHESLPQKDAESIHRDLDSNFWIQRQLQEATFGNTAPVDRDQPNWGSTRCGNIVQGPPGGHVVVLPYLHAACCKLSRKVICNWGVCAFSPFPPHIPKKAVCCNCVLHVSCDDYIDEYLS